MKKGNYWYTQLLKLLYKMKNFINQEKDISSRMEVLQIKHIEKISVSMVKVNCFNEKNIYIVVMLSKYVGKLLASELMQNINN